LSSQLRCINEDLINSTVMSLYLGFVPRNDKLIRPPLNVQSANFRINPDIGNDIRDMRLLHLAFPELHSMCHANPFLMVGYSSPSRCLESVVFTDSHGIAV
jgi:hypothetical protein